MKRVVEGQVTFVKDCTINLRFTLEHTVLNGPFCNSHLRGVRFEVLSPWHRTMFNVQHRH